MRAHRLAILALCLAARPVRADLIIPSDFSVTNGWAFNRCQSASTARICVEGLAYYGQNTTTGLFGVTYDFWSNIYGTVPTGTTLSAAMYRIVFVSLDDPNQFAQLGGDFRSGDDPLTSGQFYSPRFTANETILSTEAYFKAITVVPGFLFPDVGEAFGPVTVSPVPEPSTFGFVVLSLFAVGFTWRRQRRTIATGRTAEL